MPTIVVLSDPPDEVRLRVEGYVEDLEGILVGMVRGTGRLCRAYADLTRAKAISQHAARRAGRLRGRPVRGQGRRR
jgi:hypothetical protein